MSATISRSTLVQALGALTATCGDARRFPIVGCVVLGGDVASTTDMEAFTSVALPIRIAPVAVDCRRLYDIARSLDGDTVEFAAGDGRLAVGSGRAKYVLPTLDAADFPALPTVPELAAVDASAASLLALAARMDTDRFGVRLDWYDGTLRVAATDGYRLALAGDMGDAAVTVAGRSLKAISGVDIARMGATSDWVFVSGHDVTVGVRRSGDGGYPDVGKVLAHAKDNATGTAHVDGARLKGALDRVRLMAGESARVLLTIGDGKLTLSAHDAGAGDATDVVPVEGNATLDTAVNGNYLADWVRYAGDNVTVAVNGSGGAPLLFTTDGQLEAASYVLMPMR